MTVIEKAKELGQMIVESEEFIALQKAEIKQNNDQFAAEMIANYNSKRNELIKQMQSEDITKEQMQDIRNKLEEEFNILSSNQTIKEYIEATRNFQQLMNQVNSVISYYVNGEQSSCGGDDCGGCSGCK